jgi:hypothetical protein
MTILQVKQNSNGKLITFPILMLLIYAVCTYFPVIYMYLPFLGKIKIVLLAGIALVISYILKAGNYRNAGAYRNPVLFAWLAFFGLLIMGLLVSYDRGLALKIIEANFKYFIVFLVMIKVIDSVKRFDLVLSIFAVCGVGMALSTNLNYLFLRETFQDSYRAMAIEKGIFGDPNDLAMLFNVTLSILLYYLLTKRKKLFPILGIVTIIVAVMFTYSRGGFIGLCVVGLGFFLLIGKKKKSYVFLALIIGILFWTLAPDDYRKRISTIKEEAQFDEKTGKYTGRLEAWRMAIREGMDHPILGAGAGCSYYVSGASMHDWHVTHNSFVQVFAEMGILGLLPFLLFFVLPYRQYRFFQRLSIDGLYTYLERYRFILLSLAVFASTSFFLPQAYSPILYFLSGLSIIQTELICKLKVRESEKNKHERS